MWGTAAPATTGVWQVNLTTCVRTGEDGGRGGTSTVELDEQELPATADAEGRRRAVYRQLVRHADAGVAASYAAHEIGRDRVPDLSKYKLKGGITADELSREADAMSVWARAKARNKLDYLKRLTDLQVGRDFPQFVLNERDSSVMCLVVGSDGKPVVFSDKSGKAVRRYVLYVDRQEATPDKIIEEASWSNTVPVTEYEGNWFSYLLYFITRGGRGASYTPVVRQTSVSPPNQPGLPVYGRTWIDCERFCNRYGKTLPQSDEWTAAARSVDAASEYPWPRSAGKHWSIRTLCAGRKLDGSPGELTSAGSHRFDCSASGCVDMAGNVMEWCADVSPADGRRAVCGGSFESLGGEHHRTDRIQQWLPPTDAHAHIGYRGCIRVYLDP